MNDEMKMEIASTGNYGADYDDLGEKIRYCPVCNAASPDYVFKDRDGEFVGCTECLRKLDIYDDCTEEELR